MIKTELVSLPDQEERDVILWLNSDKCDAFMACVTAEIDHLNNESANLNLAVLTGEMPGAVQQAADAQRDAAELTRLTRMIVQYRSKKKELKRLIVTTT